ncbi:MAG TPA: cyclase family protein [Pseudothermotoga sp.]
MYVELSNILHSSIPNYPDSLPERLESILSQERGDVSNTSVLHHYTHNGTHVDAPYHFDSKGKRIHEIALENFVYEHPLLINLPKGPQQKISVTEIKDTPGIDSADLLMFRTGFAILRSKDPIAYRFLFPALDKTLAAFIREELPMVKAVMIDFLSVDTLIDGYRENFPAHKMLLSSEVSKKRPVLIIEDVNLEPLVGRIIKKVFAVPIRIKDADGAPVSIIAEIS